MSNRPDRLTGGPPIAALAGLTFNEAFRQFVLDHPDVAAAGKRAVEERHLEQDAFATGRWPRYGYRWPLKLSADDLIWQWVCGEHLLILGGPPDPPPPPSIIAVAIALANRWNVLLDAFIRGELLTIDMDGNELGRGGWRRSAATIDVQSGDLFDGDGDDATPLRRGLELSAPPAVVQPVGGIIHAGLLGDVVSSPAQRNRGRHPSYDADALLADIEQNKPFPSRAALKRWCLEPGRVKLKPGGEPPPGKSRGDAPDPHTVDDILKRIGFDKIEGIFEERNRGN